MTFRHRIAQSSRPDRDRAKLFSVGGLGTHCAPSTGMTMHAEGPIKPLNILVADDDEDVRALVADTLRADGHFVVEAHDGAELVECLRDALDDVTVRPDVIVTDVRMPNLSGLGVLAELRRSHMDLPVVLITVLADDSVRTVARRLGAVGVLKKPLDVDNLRTAVLNAGAEFARARAQSTTPTDGLSRRGRWHGP